MAKNEIRINESNMRRIVRESVANILREWTEDDMNDVQMIKDAFDSWVGNRYPCMETPSGDVIYFDYDENRNVFRAGTVTNAGLAEIESVPAQLDVRSAIDELIEALYENHPELTDGLNESKSVLNEDDWDPFGTFNDVLSECGWAYCAFEGVKGTNGNNGIRFRLVPYPQNLDGIKPVSVDEVKKAILDNVSDPSAVHFSVGFNRNAPEQRSLSVVFEDIMDLDEMNDELNETWYPEEDDDISDYAYGSIMNINLGLVDKEDISDEKLAELSHIKDEYIEDEYKYSSVMVRNVSLTDDGMDAYDVNVSVAVSAPDMPIDEIEEEVLDMVWLWAERKIGKKFVNPQIEDEKVVFDRRRKNA